MIILYLLITVFLCKLTLHNDICDIVNITFLYYVYNRLDTIYLIENFKGKIL